MDYYRRRHSYAQSTDKKKRHVEYEEYAYVLDYLPTGYIDLEHRNLRENRPIAQVVGEKAFTLLEVIPELPEDLDAAIFIVQHMPENFTASFANRLNQHSQISVKEASAGENVKNANGYLGKGGYHLLLRAKINGDKVIRLSKKPETLFIPSVDVMMDSVLNVFGNRVVGVLMTGMGDDGANGMLNIKREGGITIAESEETAIVFGMPKAAIEMGAADEVVPSYEIAKEIVNAIKSLD